MEWTDVPWLNKPSVACCVTKGATKGGEASASDQGHSIIQVGRDLRRSLVQPPAKARSALRLEHVAQGFFQVDPEILQGWQSPRPWGGQGFWALFSSA